MGEEGTWGL